jgi:hypothetical protein
MSHLYYPPLIHPNRDARNGMYPATSFYGRLQQAHNHLVGYRHKTVFQRQWRLGNKAYSGAASTNLARFAFRTGYGAAYLRIVMLQCVANTSTGDPRTEIEFVNVADAVTTTAGPWQGFIDTASTGDEPSTWRIVTDTIAVTPAKLYTATIKTYDSCRPMSILVMEIGSGTITEAVDFYSAANMVSDAPIFDATRETILGGLGSMYRQNGALQINWGNGNGAALTRSSATPVNVVNNSSTGTPTAATPGYSCDLRYRNSSSRTGVPVVLSAYASIPAGSGTVRVIDTAGTTHLTLTINSAAPQWFTTTGTITASDLKFDFQAAGDGANTLSLVAVSLYEYES